MSHEEELLSLEHELARGGGAEYDRILDDEAVVIVPGEALDKTETVRAMEASSGWDELTIEQPLYRALGDHAAILTYRFRGIRGSDFRYDALMSSVYVHGAGRWRLVLHQQTPIAS